MKKIISTFLISALLFTNIVGPVRAQIAPPPLPSAPSEPSAPTPPPAPTPPAEPSPPSEPSAPPAPTPPTAPSPAPSPSSVSDAIEASPSPTSDDQEDLETGEVNDDSGSGDTQPTGNEVDPQVLGETSGDQDESHGDGDAAIDTGNANSDAIIINDVNSNLGSGGSTDAGDINVGNAGNGAGSDNLGEVNTTNDSSTIQNNDALVTNDVDLGSISGSNDVSHNTGVDATIVTGDANTSASIVNGVNTNLDGVQVVEFNIDDTHTGDIVLEFPTTDGCGATVCGNNGNLSATNSGNGTDSNNDAGIDATNTDQTFQNNTADVTNNIELVADSGHNDASYNTGGDSAITTGDANAVATVGNFVNNNLSAAGEVLIAVVNVFGDLVGNIILPESTVSTNNTTVANTGNGADSTNNATATTANTDTTNQINTANIANNLDVAATTGNNSAENNTTGFSDGTNVINSGDAAVDVNVVNIANNNIAGDTWWLVFVNDASGNWVGQIMGAPVGSTMAGSVGTQFIVGPDGSIIAQNTGNGASSTNNATVNSTNTNTTNQNNTANVTNNVTLVANTGANDASYNTGGGSSVTTGNANVMANIVNFVNNNFSGGKVVLSVVNVFGSWLGSFVTPGQKPPEIASQGVGGAPVSNDSSSQSETSEQTNNESEDTARATSDEQVLGSVSTKPQKSGSSFGFFNSFGASNDLALHQSAVGIVEEDNTITVPKVLPKTAGAKTTIPSWFWKFFSMALGLVVIKRFYRSAHSSK